MINIIKLITRNHGIIMTENIKNPEVISKIIMTVMKRRMIIINPIIIEEIITRNGKEGIIMKVIVTGEEIENIMMTRTTIIIMIMINRNQESGIIVQDLKEKMTQIKNNEVR